MSIHLVILRRINPLVAHIIYFVSLSVAGFAILKSLKPRTTSYKPRNLDLFFTSVSAGTVSSLSVIEMEVFSNSQLIVIAFLMFLGGEVFTSMVGLHFSRILLIDSIHDDDNNNNDSNRHKPNSLKQDSIKFLKFLVLGYLVTIQVLGVSSVLLYLSHVKTANDVLKAKAINIFTFAIFVIISTFSSCGYVPTNENMIVFSKNSGLLLILLPQILLGNTLFPSCLRFSIWFFRKIFKIRIREFKYLLEQTPEVGYGHLLPGLHSACLVPTIMGFILTGFVMFCAMDWNSSALIGLNSYQKVVGVLFQSASARHAGETIVDLSAIAPAILVFFVVMMYLPPYTSFVPILKRDIQIEPNQSQGKRRKGLIIRDNLVFSQLSYLAIFIILICITERKSLKDDPLNFSVFNITFEVISAYGNAGFSTGYSCERELKRNPNCVNKWYGFAGKWSDEGKIILILVMFFGRSKKFNMNGGRAWRLL